MKKIICAIMAIVSYMVMVASPLFVKPIKVYASNENFTGFTNTPLPILEDLCDTGPVPNKYYTIEQVTQNLKNSSYNISNDDYFLYFVGYFDDNYYYTIAIDFQSADCTFENGCLTLDNVTGGASGDGILYLCDWYKNSGSDSAIRNYAFDSAVFDFANKTFTVELDNDYASIELYRNGSSCTKIWNVQSNIPETLSSLGVNLQISFAQPFTGSISRKTTGNTGITSTSDGNIMYVTNRGADAQFCMAIVPTGQSLSFNTWTYTGRDNIIGNPTYVYTCDEWQSFGALEALNIADSSASANSIYAPCAWHTVEQGANRSYWLAWEAMKLEANKSYDVVVYGCLNSDMEEMSGFYYDNRNLGATYTVSGSINDVEEVYRSTFTISDPATFNPDYSNPADGSHPWNPDIDNKDLFSMGSAYKDENGNIVIKGFKTGTSGYSWEIDTSNTGGSSGSGLGNINVNQSFGGFFNFFRSILNFFPSTWSALILMGLVAIVVAAIIKKVSS